MHSVPILITPPKEVSDGTSTKYQNQVCCAEGKKKKEKNLRNFKCKERKTRREEVGGEKDVLHGLKFNQESVQHHFINEGQPLYYNGWTKMPPIRDLFTNIIGHSMQFRLILGLSNDANAITTKILLPEVL